MKKVFLITILFFTASFHSKACLNYYYTVDQDGNRHESDPARAFNTNFNLPLIKEKLDKLYQKLNTYHDYRQLSDYSVLLMKAGKPKTALTILIELYKHFPNEYIIAANLGTAYELNGNLDSALKYIKRDIELNPNDHEGSEWIHVKILECKLKLKQDPNYLKKNSVLQLTDDQRRKGDLLNQLDIQIRERFPFTPGPDPIMASLLTTLGDQYSRTNSVEMADVVYKIVYHYYGDSSAVIRKKILVNGKLLKKYQTSPDSNSEPPSMLPPLNYKDYLDDNNKDKFVINWYELTTIPDSLLKLVDYNASFEADSLKIVKEEAEKRNAPATAHKTIHNIFIACLLFGSLFILIVFLKFKYGNWK